MAVPDTSVIVMLREHNGISKFGNFINSKINVRERIEFFDEESKRRMKFDFYFVNIISFRYIINKFSH